MSDNREILDLANRFESIATDGFEGRPYRPALSDLATRVRERPGMAPRVAHALGIMIQLIGESDPEGRFAAKIVILREAVGLLSDA
ncbi:hypothetical protein TSH7_00290 [Azospirillum sp. TSH7]|uniref:hypothetical protein n=1 Tax=unclassified Azospirillum TaxID=2630922 RepID=UPI000D61348C|nr:MULTISPECIES: hypothetical protein [unclassified Azospirillum]PWC69614.1 hypothetical protein TSH7_00290 [Azospirillum sp. TSH7]PWC69835.1 hypothetical protein TSH20_08210 [Azospirillum sp. TSH20]